MIKKSTWLHLRIPFSYFLLPVFLFALSVSPSPDVFKTIIVFFCLHIFLYPASNGYNSYFDKDEESIGGLKTPPPVQQQLYYTALMFDAIALLLGLLVSIQFVIMIFLYGLASKAYSHPAVRLKKHPITGWLVAGFFQGFFTFLAVYQGINELGIDQLNNFRILMPAGLSTLLLWGSYPMTQVYQHGEDARRGDITISLKLGILGTFHFTAIAFTIANIGFLFFYYRFYGLWPALMFQAFLLPVLIYFGWWYLKARQNIDWVDFKHTMRLNFISSTMLSMFFLLFTFIY